MIEEASKLTYFEQAIMPHFSAAYSFARWLMRNDDAAQDAVQEAYLRAFRFFDSFHGSNGRAWLLAIVRNTCWSYLRHERAHESVEVFDQEIYGSDSEEDNPERCLIIRDETASLRACIDSLPVEYRETVVLREIEQLSYKEIAEITSVPIGTVMSRLCRARRQLRNCYLMHATGGRK